MSNRKGFMEVDSIEELGQAVRTTTLVGWSRERAALKEENKRLREAFDLFEKVDARVVWEGLGLGNGLAEEIDECIMRTRAALKEE